MFSQNDVSDNSYQTVDALCHDDRVRTGMTTHQMSLHSQMSKVADRLLTLWTVKLKEYGSRRYDDDNSLEFDAWMCFSDVSRKFVRLEQLTKTATKQGYVSDSLQDAYADLAVYAISALMILEDWIGPT